MKFEDIFKNPGRYTAESFADGVFFDISVGVSGNELKILSFDSPTEFITRELNIPIYQGLFDKEFVKVLNRGQLFGQQKIDLFKK